MASHPVYYTQPSPSDSATPTNTPNGMPGNQPGVHGYQTVRNMSSNIVITDVIVEPPNPQRFRSDSHSKRSRWLKKEKAREKEPVSYRVQKVFNIMERQGLAAPMDVRSQYDVNEQIYRSLSTIGIEEVLYPLPRSSSLLGLRNVPLHHFWSEENAQHRYREKLPSDGRDASKSRERRVLATERSEYPNAGCRRPKRDVVPGKGPVPRRKLIVTSESRQPTNCNSITLPKEWNDFCVFPEKVVCENLNPDIKEYYKKKADRNEGKMKSVSLADNYDTEELSGIDSCLAPSFEVDHRTVSFLNRQELSMPIQVLPEPSRSKLASNPKYVRHQDPCCTAESKEQETPQRYVKEFEVVSYHDPVRLETNGSKLEVTNALTKGEGIHRDEVIRSPLKQKTPHLDSSDGMCSDSNTPQIHKSCMKIKKNTTNQRNETEKSYMYSENRDKFESDIVATASAEEEQARICCGDSKKGFKEHITAFEIRSAEKFCEMPSERRVSWASDLEMDTRGTHHRTSDSRSSKDKPKEKRRNQTPVIMYSESECSLLCQKYNN
ncbi:uncharacterized protein LOC132561091 [Ylistrum balloti]|uniref:uncharacterized protein LOC132561091 n=1 Tax=Ylistrum balloti TaxID=509963 RepID=UPI0029059581|nr:uncharacterized protein LOC132561091 [Ylistrum balloti]